MATRLRVVLENLLARGGDWPRRREVLREGLGKLQSDLVALVEAS